MSVQIALNALKRALVHHDAARNTLVHHAGRHSGDATAKVSLAEWGDAIGQLVADAGNTAEANRQRDLAFRDNAQLRAERDDLLKRLRESERQCRELEGCLVGWRDEARKASDARVAVEDAIVRVTAERDHALEQLRGAKAMIEQRERGIQEMNSAISTLRVERDDWHNEAARTAAERDKYLRERADRLEQALLRQDGPKLHDVRAGDALSVQRHVMVEVDEEVLAERDDAVAAAKIAVRRADDLGSLNDDLRRQLAEVRAADQAKLEEIRSHADEIKVLRAKNQDMAAAFAACWQEIEKVLPNHAWPQGTHVDVAVKVLCDEVGRVGRSYLDEWKRAEKLRQQLNDCQRAAPPIRPGTLVAVDLNGHAVPTGTLQSLEVGRCVYVLEAPGYTKQPGTTTAVVGEAISTLDTERRKRDHLVARLRRRISKQAETIAALIGTREDVARTRAEADRELRIADDKLKAARDKIDEVESAYKFRHFVIKRDTSDDEAVFELERFFMRRGIETIDICRLFVKRVAKWIGLGLPLHEVVATLQKAANEHRGAADSDGSASLFPDNLRIASLRTALDNILIAPADHPNAHAVRDAVALCDRVLGRALP